MILKKTLINKNNNKQRMEFKFSLLNILKP